MGVNEVSADHVISELLDMGFEFAKAIEALEAVGPVLNDAVDFILNDSCNENTYRKSQHAFNCSNTQNRSSREDAKTSQSLRWMKQSHITDHLPSFSGGKRDISESSSKLSFPGVKKAILDEHITVDGINQLKVEPFPFWMDCHSDIHGSFQYQQVPFFNNTDGQAMMVDWEKKATYALQKHFGFSSLRGFQKEAIKAWLEHKDCLILAATGAGKSLCFQIPALLSGKIVVVISPLISLMHDQCSKLEKNGIPACFLGSGQTDSTVERKALNGVYRIVYACPETVLRLIVPLMNLAEKNMIALFAIDEVHCVSKWGHDFRPDYRCLSALRENFSVSHIKSLRFDIPLMALTATATLSVREDVMKSLLMSKETKIVLTTFFRPNLRFSVKHSRTSFASSYNRDFRDLVNFYAASRMNNSKGKNKMFNNWENNISCSSSSLDASSDEDDEDDTSESDSYYSDDDDSCASSSDEDRAHPRGDQLTVDFLEDEFDTHYCADDLDVSCAEFVDVCPHKNMELCGITQAPDSFESLGHGPTIIYVPTRKETTKLAEYFCRSGVKAAAYHAKLPKAHLRSVHVRFHQNLIEVIVATIAFGMGIDKSNIRRVIHYGWPQAVSSDGKRVKRLHPLPIAEVADEKARTVLVENLPEDYSEDSIRGIFGTTGHILGVIIRNPQQIAALKKADFAISSKLHALVVYDTVEAAESAVSSLNDEMNWRNGMRVQILLKRMEKYGLVQKPRKRDSLMKNNGAEALENQNGLDKEEEDNGNESKGVRRNKSRSRGRGKHQQPTNDQGHRNVPAVSGAEGVINKPFTGPKMPDGTRGFTMGRGRPITT